MKKPSESPSINTRNTITINRITRNGELYFSISYGDGSQDLLLTPKQLITQLRPMIKMSSSRFTISRAQLFFNNFGAIASRLPVIYEMFGIVAPHSIPSKSMRLNSLMVALGFSTFATLVSIRRPYYASVLLSGVEGAGKLQLLKLMELLSIGSHASFPIALTLTTGGMLGVLSPYNLYPKTTCRATQALQKGGLEARNYPSPLITIFSIMTLASELPNAYGVQTWFSFNGSYSCHLSQLIHKDSNNKNIIDVTQFFYLTFITVCAIILLPTLSIKMLECATDKYVEPIQKAKSKIKDFHYTLFKMMRVLIDLLNYIACPFAIYVNLAADDAALIERFNTNIPFEESWLNVLLVCSSAIIIASELKFLKTGENLEIRGLPGKIRDCVLTVPQKLGFFQPAYAERWDSTQTVVDIYHLHGRLLEDEVDKQALTGNAENLLNALEEINALEDNPNIASTV